MEVAHRSREGFPRLGSAAIAILFALLAVAALATLWSRQLDGMDFTFAQPVVAAVILKRHVDVALALWGILVASFYSIAAARGERPNVCYYRWCLISFFALEGAFYLLLMLRYKHGMPLYSALALTPVITCFGFLAYRLSVAGNVFIPLHTKFSGLTQEELDRLYSEQPHTKR